MALKGQPIAVGTTDTTVYTCPATLEGSVHGLVFSNVTGSAATITIKMYIQSTGVTTTVATGISVAANSTYTWPKPVDVNAGDIIKASASTGSAIVCVYSAYENAATPAATGITPRGAWSSGATYATNDSVSYTNGNSYLAIQASTNQQPDTQTAYWQILAERGPTGSGDLTGPASSTDNAVARFDGTTGKIVQNSAVTVADTTGDITGGKYNGLTISTSTGTLTIANGKTLAVDNSVTFVGTDSSTVSFGTGGTIAYTGGTLAQFASTTSSQLAGVISDETGSGSLVFATSPTLVTPALGTPTSGNFSTGTFTWPTFNQNTSGTAAGLSSTLAVASGGTGLTSGTSGGVLYYSATGTLASSAALAANSVVIGGGAGVAPATTTTGTGVITAIGNAVNASGGFITYATYAPASGKTLTVSNSITLAGTDGTTMTFPSASSSIGYLNIPQVTKTGAYTPTDTSDVGKHISITTGGVTVNASIYSAGDVFSIYNNSGSNQTITAGSNVTFRLAGTATTGNRTLAQYGVATLLCVTGGANPVFVVSGSGVT